MHSRENRPPDVPRSHGSVEESWEHSGLFPAASGLAKYAQMQHKSLLAASLGFMILGVVAGLLPEGSRWHPPLALALLGAALAASILLALLKLDRVWFSARAIAESAKTRMWKYAMRAHPYDIEDNEAKLRLLDDIARILRDNTTTVRKMGIRGSASPPISSHLTTLRRLPADVRLGVYSKQRLSAQSDWYAERARRHDLSANRWVGLVVLANAGAVGLAAARLALSSLPYLPVEVLAIIASSALAWMQAGKFRELATSYALAAQELLLISGALPKLCSEEDLDQLVRTAESAISREHALWAVREDRFRNRE